MLLSNTGSYTLGCEITDRSIKTIQLKRAGLSPRIVTIGHTQLKSGIIKNGKIEDYDSLVSAMKSAVSKLKGKKLLTMDAVLSLPDSQTFVKTVSIERVSEDKMFEQVQKEIQKHFPLEANEANFDWQQLSQSSKNSKIIVSAVSKSIAQPYIALCKAVGWHIQALELESAATSRALLGKDLPVNAIIIDIGYAHSSLIIVSEKTIQFTLSLPISGRMINDTISHKLKLSTEQAERAKIKCGVDETKCRGALKIVLDAILDDLAFKVEDALEYYTEQSSKEAGTIDAIYVTGGGAHLANIEQVLTTKLKRTVQKGNPVKFVRPINKKTFPEMSKISLHSFVTPIGLALRGIHKKFL